MNREQKRDFIRKASKNGMGKKAAKVFADSIGSVHSEPQDIQDGDKVIIGPGPMTAHEINEHISVESLEKTTALYGDMIEALCK